MSRYEQRKKEVFAEPGGCRRLLVDGCRIENYARIGGDSTATTYDSGSIGRTDG